MIRGWFVGFTKVLLVIVLGFVVFGCFFVDLFCGGLFDLDFVLSTLGLVF